MQQSVPLISCLCVTRARVALLNRAVRCFLDQSYPHIELVILFESDDAPGAPLDDSARARIHDDFVTPRSAPQ